MALHDAGAIDFEHFRAELIAEIAAHGADGVAEENSGYYERWLAALEQVLLEEGVVSADELDARAAAIAHEWAHDHDR